MAGRCVLLLLHCLVYGGIMVNTQSVLKLGVIYQDVSIHADTIMDLGVSQINSDPTILPNHIIQLTALYDSKGLAGKFQNLLHVCSLLEEGVTTIIGPMTSTAVKASHPMCLGFHMPMITPSASDDMLQNQNEFKYLLRMLAPDSTQLQAMTKFFKTFHWDTVAILADNTDYGINGMMTFQSISAENEWRILSSQQYVATTNYSMVNAVEALETIKGTGARVILFNGLAQHAIYIFEQAHTLSMMGEGWVWVTTDGVTGFDLLETAVHSKRYLEGLIGTRPVSHSGKLYEDLLDSWRASDPSLDSSNSTLSTYALAYYDSLRTYATAMHQLLEVDGDTIDTRNISCMEEPAVPWEHGDTVIEYLKQVETDGAMRYLAFTDKGIPKNPQYNVVRLGRDAGWEEIGMWSENTGLNLTDADDIVRLTGLGGTSLVDVRDYVGDLANKTLNIATVEHPPFVFIQTDGECTGNACYSGYCIDLLDNLAAQLNFKYTLYTVTDGKFGLVNEVTNKWNGMIGDLIPDENGDIAADMAVGAITISYERQEVVAFTKPYRDIQQGVLLGTLDQDSFDPWSFLMPLSYDLWGFTIGTAFAVAVVISLLDKISPFGHHGFKAQLDSEHEFQAMDKNDDGSVDYWEREEWMRDKHSMSLHNSVMWSLASLFEQGGEVHPRAWSGRVVAACWWLGALIIVQSYTANLAAFLTIKQSAGEINSLDDLAQQTVVKYGTLRDSQTQAFFDSAPRSPYKEMADNMRKWDSYRDNVVDAINYTAETNGSYAFITDYPTAQYWRGQICSLRMLDSSFANFGYGFALPQGSTFTEELTIKIYQLREAGFTDSLDEKWIQKTAVCSVEEDSADIAEETVQIGMPSLWGIFWIVYAGFGVSFVVLVIEWLVSAAMWVDKNNPKRPQTLAQCLKHRLGLLKRDVMQNWFYNCCNSTDDADVNGDGATTVESLERQGTAKERPVSNSAFVGRPTSTSAQHLYAASAKQNGNGVQNS